jgi:hypothetical protein
MGSPIEIDYVFSYLSRLKRTRTLRSKAYIAPIGFGLNID